MNDCSVVYRTSLAAALLWSAAFPVAALEACASVGKLDAPSGRNDPCEGLAYFAEVAGKCAAEIQEDRRLQRHAAGILELERQTRIDESVLRSLRLMRDNPNASRGTNSDPVAFDRQIAIQESRGAKNRTALAERRSSAVSAGFPQLAQAGSAQTVITNAVWRYLDSAVRPQLVNCRSGTEGRKAAADFAGMLAVSLSHGNPVESRIVRQLLDEETGAR